MFDFEKLFKMCVCLFVCLSGGRAVCLLGCMFVCLFVCLFLGVFVCWGVCWGFFSSWVFFLFFINFSSCFYILLWSFVLFSVCMSYYVMHLFHDKLLARMA